MLGVMEKTRILRAKEERIAVLETDNAILHLQIAQLQCSFKALLQRKVEALKPSFEMIPAPACKKCEEYKQIVKTLQNQTQSLRKSLCELISQFNTYKQQISNKLQTLTTIVPAVINKSSNRVAQINEIQMKYLKEKARRKELHNALVELRGNIRVHCRVRPVLSFDSRTAECVSCIDEETVRVECIQSSVSGPTLTGKHYEYDRVHGPHDSQQTVFSEVQPLITSLLDGYNVCIMAYGQTGSGKTYTMLGRGGVKNLTEQPSQGVVPLAAQELFRLIEEKDLDIGVSVTVAEIYNEQIRDLLSPQKQDMAKHEVLSSANGGEMEVTNLTLRPVGTNSELISLVHQGMKRRASDSTKIHEHSSRSHLIVTIHLGSASNSPRTRSTESMGTISAASSFNSLNATISPVNSQESTPMVSPASSPPRSRQRVTPSSSNSQIYVSSTAPSVALKTSSSSFSGMRRIDSSLVQNFHVKLQLVDLAGSECVGISGVSGNSLREAQYINKSLSSLSDVLGALAERRSHIPYRNSTLTHLLQDTIGGNAKMVMFLCVSPSTQSVGETVRVLGFGSRARQVQRIHQQTKKQRTLNRK